MGECPKDKGGAASGEEKVGFSTPKELKRSDEVETYPNYSINGMKRKRFHLIRHRQRVVGDTFPSRGRLPLFQRFNNLIHRFFQ